MAWFAFLSRAPEETPGRYHDLPPTVRGCPAFREGSSGSRSVAMPVQPEPLFFDGERERVGDRLDTRGSSRAYRDEGCMHPRPDKPVVGPDFDGCLGRAVASDDTSVPRENKGPVVVRGDGHTRGQSLLATAIRSPEGPIRCRCMRACRRARCPGEVCDHAALEKDRLVFWRMSTHAAVSS